MKIETCFIDGLKIIHLDVFEDNRGYFVEKYNQQTENKLSDILSYIDKKEEVVSYPYMLFYYLKTIFKR